MNKAWIFLFLGALLEVGWVTGLKHSHDLLTWSGTIVAIVLSFSLLIRATADLPVGTAYAIFTGLGTTGTVFLEMLVFGEPFKVVKILLILVLLIGVIGLKVVTGESKKEGESA